MWPPWLSSPRRIATAPSRSPTTRNFSCSSFKDIQNLITEDSNSGSIPLPRSPSLFRRIRISTSVLRAFAAAAHRCETSNSTPKPSLKLPNSDQRITIYFTSLRVVRKTFEDCKYVRSILWSFGVPIDERDLSMDVKFLEELQAITGKKKPSLPSVFIAGEFIGGADEIRQLHESGELKRLVRDLPVIGSNVCDLCGGLRYVVCDQCDGSHKIYTVKSGFRSCSECNVNGLIRCPECFSVHLCHTLT